MGKNILLALALTFSISVFGCAKKDLVEIILADASLTEEAMERIVADTASHDKLIDKLLAQPLAVEKLSDKVIADTTLAGYLIEKLAKSPETLTKMMQEVEVAKAAKPMYMK